MRPAIVVDAVAAFHQINCPSGLSYTVRKYKGKEANLFTDKKLVREGGLISAILSAIVVEVTDPGPYQLDTNGHPPWDKMLTGDRIVSLIESRIGTYAAEMEISVQCDNPTCRARWKEDIDLSQLVRKELSPEALNTFLNGNEFDTYLVDGDGTRRNAKFHLLTGKDERDLIKLARRYKDQQATASVMQRINSVEGVQRNDLMKLIEEIDLDEMTELVDRMDSFDCGVETSIECECPECEHVQEEEVPLGGKEFFLPKRKRSTSTTAAAS